jgi:TetR/AcrR family transcriptional repressor of bet genes
MRSAQQGKPSQRAQRVLETRARIVEATIRSIAARGVAGASMGSIMRQAEISRGLVGYHFGSKGNLLVAAFQRLCDDYRSMLGIGPVQQVVVGEDAERQLHAVIGRCFEWPAEYQDRQYAWFGFWALARTEPRLRSVNRQVNDEAAAHLGTLLAAAGRKRGRIINEQLAGRELSATIDGAWLHLTTGVESLTPDQAVKMCQQCAEHLLERDWT